MYVNIFNRQFDKINWQTNSIVSHCSEQAMSLIRCRIVYLCHLLTIFFAHSIKDKFAAYAKLQIFIWLLPIMVSLRGRCLEVMTCSEGAMDWIRIIGWLGSYVPGTANSRSRHISSLGETYWSSREVSCGQSNMHQCICITIIFWQKRFILKVQLFYMISHLTSYHCQKYMTTKYKIW